MDTDVRVVQQVRDDISGKEVSVMTMYAIPSMLDTYAQEVKVVESATKYRKWDRDRDKEKEERKKKTKNQFQTILEKETEKDLGQLGCFFEMRA